MVPSKQSPLSNLLGVRCIHMCGKYVAMCLSPLHPQSSQGLSTSSIHHSSAGFCGSWLFVCLLACLFLCILWWAQTFYNLLFPWTLINSTWFLGKKETIACLYHIQKCFELSLGSVRRYWVKIIIPPLGVVSLMTAAEEAISLSYAGTNAITIQCLSGAASEAHAWSFWCPLCDAGLVSETHGWLPPAFPHAAFRPGHSQQERYVARLEVQSDFCSCHLYVWVHVCMCTMLTLFRDFQINSSF